jgi:hypothetical protein
MAALAIYPVSVFCKLIRLNPVRLRAAPAAPRAKEAEPSRAWSATVCNSSFVMIMNQEKPPG